MTSIQYSKVTLPEALPPYPTILSFLIDRFPHVAANVWAERISAGKVLDDDGVPIHGETPFVPGRRIFYFREVTDEPVIPFGETILFQNDHLVVACKPHFLPVNPTGPYVSECLMNRLRARTGNPDLVPINRIDRETAGIVLFSAERRSRDLYYRLFREGEVEKTYHAIGQYKEEGIQTEWLVENRIVKGEPWFRMKTALGEANSKSIIKMAEARGGTAKFILHPLTGKTHQLRLHMGGLGFGIVNDRYYPDLQPQSPDDFEKPLQLLAKEIRFRDPVSGVPLDFTSPRTLLY